MRIGVLNIERTGVDRCCLYSSIVEILRGYQLDCLIFPGGFFEGRKRSRFVGYLKDSSPGTVVIIGWDQNHWKNSKKDLISKKGRGGKGSKKTIRQIWAVSPAGVIELSIQEAWQGSGSCDEQLLAEITERSYNSNGVDVDLYCCGDVFIDLRVFNGRIAAITAHQSATGRWKNAMCRLNKPAFLSHFVNNPYKIKGLAYLLNESLVHTDIVDGCSMKQTRWRAIIYNIQS